MLLGRFNIAPPPPKKIIGKLLKLKYKEKKEWGKKDKASKNFMTV